MTTKRITRTDYDKLLTVTLPATATAKEILNHLGTLIDAAHAYHDKEGAQAALAIAASRDTTTWNSTDRALLHFFLANANDDLWRNEQTTPAQQWEWTSKHFDETLLHLRQARNEPGFTTLPAAAQCKILTNLGNNLSTIGRYIEAQEQWNHALTIDPTFPMARANRGYGRYYYAGTLHERGHREAFLHLAHEDLRTSTPHVADAEAKQAFAAIQAKIEQLAPAAYWQKPHTFRTRSLGQTPEEIAYRTWTLNHRLFLNPINDLTTESAAARDNIHTPTMLVPLDEPPSYQGFFNQLKQEYTTARFLLYQGLDHQAPAWADKDVMLYNTLDYPAYGTNLELTKLAYRSCYSLFDKIAYLINQYLKLGISEKRVNFKSLWYEKEDPKRALKATFHRYANLPLRGLYWISRDLDENNPRHVSPDAAQLSTIRQHLEHKYLKAHTIDWPLAKGDPRRDDTLALNIDQHEFEAKAQRLITMTRAALLYLILAITVEERHRRKGSNDTLIETELPTYDDEWKT